MPSHTAQQDDGAGDARRAHLRIVAAAAEMFQQKIHGYYAEVRRIIRALDSGVGLQVTPGLITLAVSIDTVSSNTSGVGTNKYTIPQDKDFILESIVGDIAFQDPDSAVETLSIGNLGNPSFQDRVTLKAANALCNLHIDSGDNTITKGVDFTLGTIAPATGGEPIVMGGRDRPGGIIGHGRVVQFQVTLQDTAAGIIGGKTRYGVILNGQFMSRPRAGG